MTRGFTAIEAIVAMVILAVIAAVTAGSIIFVVQLFVYLPDGMEVRRVAHEVADTVIEGDSGARGLRYAATVVDAAKDRITYSYGYPETVLYVRYAYDPDFLGTGKKICVATSVNGTTWPMTSRTVPSTIRSDIQVCGASAADTIFRYYRSDGSAWTQGSDPVESIARVTLDITVSTAQAKLKGRDTSFSLLTGVEIKRYQ